MVHTVINDPSAITLLQPIFKWLSTDPNTLPGSSNKISSKVLQGSRIDSYFKDSSLNAIINVVRLEIPPDTQYLCNNPTRKGLEF